MKHSTCLVCGSLIGTFSGTKPKIYCSSNCRDFFKYKQALERSILKLSASPDSSKLIRGDMFRLANLVGNGTKSLKDSKDE